MSNTVQTRIQLGAWILATLTAISAAAQSNTLTAKRYDSGFPQGHDTFNGMGTGSDGNVYYVLSSYHHDVGAKMFAFDPAAETTRLVGDLTEVCGEQGKNTIVQGKSHVKFVEAKGKLYFATHLGFYSMVDGMEKVGIPPAGWYPYPGGHLLAYDLTSGEFQDFGIPVEGEGILTMSMDANRGRIYGISWPKGYFFRYDLASGEHKNLGLFAEMGEDGRGETYRTLCRSIAVDPRDGAAYFTTATGDILRYSYESDSVSVVTEDNLKKDYFGLYDPNSPGHMGYNWRQTVWSPSDSQIYGVHGNSGYLFRFDPTVKRVEVLDRITSEPSKRAGMFDQFSYGYLGFELGHDGRTLFYLTGGPIYSDGKRVAGKESTAMGESKGKENVHLITYDIPTLAYTDHGPIFYDDGSRPQYVNSIAVTKEKLVCFLAHVTEGEHPRTDLVTVKLK
ncbi:MAG: hypothetical protein AMXMBFR84_43580 [Candidatus Hydrogenedentota bacterium]